MRTIKLKLPTQTNLVTIQTPDVNTLGDLQKAILDENINVDITNSKFIARGTNAEYTNNKDALLPQGDVILFVTPLHTNKGGEVTAEDFLDMTKKEALEYISTLNYNTIRTFSRTLNNLLEDYIVDTSKKFSSMVEELKMFIELNYDEEGVTKETEEEIGVPELLKSATEYLVIAVRYLIKAATKYESTNYAHGITETTLRDEHEKLLQLNK